MYRNPLAATLPAQSNKLWRYDRVIIGHNLISDILGIDPYRGMPILIRVSIDHRKTMYCNISNTNNMSAIYFLLVIQTTI